MLERLEAILTAHPKKEDFYRATQLYWPEMSKEYHRVVGAYQDAKDAFRRKSREDGTRYFEHLRSVAIILMVYQRIRDADLIIAGFMHDTVEDLKFWTLDRLAYHYGRQVAEDVSWLTKFPESGFPSQEARDHAYHQRLRLAPRRVILVKLADNLHNQLTLGACDEAKRRRKIRETREIYIPLAEEVQFLIYELEEIVERNEAFLATSGQGVVSIASKGERK